MKNKIVLALSFLMVLALFSACSAPGTLDSAEVIGDKSSLIAALEEAGATVETGESFAQDFFTVPAQVLHVDGADLQVFEYASAEAMAAEADLVDPAGSPIGTSMVSWIDTPHFFKAGNLIVLYLGDDVALLDLLQAALGSQFAGG